MRRTRAACSRRPFAARTPLSSWRTRSCMGSPSPSHQRCARLWLAQPLSPPLRNHCLWLAHLLSPPLRNHCLWLAQLLSPPLRTTACGWPTPLPSPAPTPLGAGAAADPWGGAVESAAHAGQGLPSHWPHPPLPPPPPGPRSAADPGQGFRAALEQGQGDAPGQGRHRWAPATCLRGDGEQGEGVLSLCRRITSVWRPCCSWRRVG